MTASYGYDVFGELRSGAPGATDWLFTGEQLDGESAFYYLRARYYDPQSGRFLSQDPLPAANLYAYVGNNPVSYVDPSGLTPNNGEGGATFSGASGPPAWPSCAIITPAVPCIYSYVRELTDWSYNVAVPLQQRLGELGAALVQWLNDPYNEASLAQLAAGGLISISCGPSAFITGGLGVGACVVRVSAMVGATGVKGHYAKSTHQLTVDISLGVLAVTPPLMGIRTGALAAASKLIGAIAKALSNPEPAYSN